jgi:hypothetical protein
VKKPAIKINDDWELGSDRLQWILRHQRPGKKGWDAILFISSTKAVLARCMRESGISEADAQGLLAQLPDTFREWRSLGAGKA